MICSIFEGDLRETWFGKKRGPWFSMLIQCPWTERESSFQFVVKCDFFSRQKCCVKDDELDLFMIKRDLELIYLALTTSESWSYWKIVHIYDDSSDLTYAFIYRTLCKYVPLFLMQSFTFLMKTVWVVMCMTNLTINVHVTHNEIWCSSCFDLTLSDVQNNVRWQYFSQCILDTCWHNISYVRWYFISHIAF